MVMTISMVPHLMIEENVMHHWKVQPRPLYIPPIFGWNAKTPLEWFQTYAQ
jgi:hypothetical protein